jgi:hypothetical protein
VTPKDEKLANSAAPRAGTIRSGMVMVSKLVIGEAKTPSMPAITVEITHGGPCTGVPSSKILNGDASCLQETAADYDILFKEPNHEHFAITYTAVHWPP